MNTSKSDTFKNVATNRKARHEYFIDDTYEAGIVLTGTEIKSVRAGSVSLNEGYVQVSNGEAWLYEVHIAQYEQAGQWTHNPKRTRKLLLHRKEIIRLQNSTQERGYTIVPLRMYIKGRIAKVEIGVARGKRQYDKREVIAQRDADRSLRREWKEFGKQEVSG